MKQLKVGIIGCGEISKMHIPAIQKNSGAEIVGIADLSEELLSQTASKFNLNRRYRDPLELLKKERPDVIHILTPPQTHYVLTKAALEVGCHVFVEKPLAMNAREAEELAALARQKNLLLCTGHSHLFDEVMRRARALVEKGVIGSICGIDSYYGFDMDPKYFSAKGSSHWAHRLPGGIHMNRIDHPLSVVLPFMGPMKSVTAAAVDVKDVVPLNIPGEMRITLSDGKMLANITMSLAASPRFHFLTLYGTKGTLQVDFLNKRIVQAVHIQGMPRAISRLLINFRESWTIFSSTIRSVINVARKKFLAVDGIPTLIGQFYDAIQKGGPCPLPPQQVVTAMQIMDEVWKQTGCVAKSGPVDPGSFPKPARRGTTRILVTGGTGFVGRNLLKALCEQTHDDVRVLARNPIKANATIKNLPVEVVFGDLSDPKALASAMEGVDVVYHLAAAMGGTWNDYQEGTVQATKNLIEAAIAKRVRKFVYCSSIAVYGIPKTKNGKITEETPFAESDMTDYMRSKIEAERVVQEAVKRDGLNATILRPGVIYGDLNSRISRIGYKAANLFVKIGLNSNELPLTYVGNVVKALMLAGSAANGIAGGAYNVIDDDHVTQIEYIRKLTQYSGTKFHYVFFPYTLASVMGVLTRSGSKFSGIIKKIAGLLSSFHLKTCSYKLVYDNSKIKQELGWKPEGNLDGHFQRISEQK